ncbi:C4-dicarboxylate ABC transporter substrate-binding protein [Brevibacillus choshinensis]|uniref:C4-dicarboxylate ABC transporter substrate-binding protein n=1 Tax=Brevibacillus choshinensis TaxID=54911 RepID=A0ABR5N754_BRECH|nr:TAXI family TRAP transporter solute-binding subunit [Brevibacillus choshinensis]KQL46459.1 C4-dicarboxylate ABC transporter substrate-binding protein [Brevibacillus choshinensis]KQL46462.1 C4-dicarboxylate ABC transporter substrate-binding protein [Brevibacillus choshinensis]
MMIKNKMLTIMSSVLLVLTVSACGGQSTTAPQAGQSGGAAAGGGAEQKFLTIATGGSSGPYYTLGGAMAKIYKEKLGYNASVQSTGASVENINLVKAKKADVAFVMSDVTTFAYAGQENFKEGGAIKDLRAMAGLYLNYVQIVTLKDRNIKSVADLKGKRVGVGAPNSGVEVNARMVLAGHGISYDDIKADYLSYAEAIEQLKNNAIDAAFVTSGLPNSTVIDLSTTKDVEIVPIKKEDVEKMKEQFPFFVSAEIPAGLYKNDQPIQTAAIRNILLVRNDLSDDQVYKLTKTFFDEMEALRAAHSAAKEIDVKEAGKNLVVPLHPGAEKYYKEVGALN